MTTQPETTPVEPATAELTPQKRVLAQIRPLRDKVGTLKAKRQTILSDWISEMTAAGKTEAISLVQAEYDKEGDRLFNLLTADNLTVLPKTEEIMRLRVALRKNNIEISDAFQAAREIVGQVRSALKGTERAELKKIDAMVPYGEVSKKDVLSLVGAERQRAFALLEVFLGDANIETRRSAVASYRDVLSTTLANLSDREALTTGAVAIATLVNSASGAALMTTHGLELADLIDVTDPRVALSYILAEKYSGTEVLTERAYEFIEMLLNQGNDEQVKSAVQEFLTTAKDISIGKSPNGTMFPTFARAILSKAILDAGDLDISGEHEEADVLMDAMPGTIQNGEIIQAVLDAIANVDHDLYTKLSKEVIASIKARTVKQLADKYIDDLLASIHIHCTDHGQKNTHGNLVVSKAVREAVKTVKPAKRKQPVGQTENLLPTAEAVQDTISASPATAEQSAPVASTAVEEVPEGADL